LPGESSGRQRRHGLKPAASAWALLLKKTVFDVSGGFPGQIGRQYIFVVLAPEKKSPSYRTSRAILAARHTSNEKALLGSPGAIMTKWIWPE
jgi:hypothetical protein